MSIAALLQFSCQTRDNFVELSKPLVEYLKHVNQGARFSSLQPLVIQSGKSSVLSSWSGNFCNEESALVISINSIFATNNALEDNSQVNISILLDKALPAASVSICPLKNADWDVMNLNSESIEYSLRDQVLFVRTGLVFTYFLSPSLPVLLKVLSTTPSNVVYLQEHTEVHILPTTCETTNSFFKEEQTNKSSTFKSSAVLSFTGLSLDEEDQLTVCTNNDSSKKHLTQNLSIKGVSSLDSVIRGGNDNGHLPPYQCFASRELFTSNSNRNICCLETLKCYAEISCYTDKNDKEEETSEEIKIVLSINFLPPKLFKRMFPNSSFDELYANPIVLEQLGVKHGNIVTLNCYHGDLVTCKGILLHCNDVTTDNEGAVKTLLLKYLENCIRNSENDIVLNQGTLLKLEVNGKIIHVVTELMGVVNAVYGRVSLDTLEFLTVEKDNESIVDPKSILHVERKEILCEDVLDEGIGKVFIHLKDLLLKPQQIASQYLPFTNHQKVILVHGTSSAVSSGCGKSFVAHLLKTFFTARPLCYFVNVVDCVLLRGKKVETIVDCWNNVLDEAVTKGDAAIIVFDDLDELLPNMDIHQDGNISNVYGEKLSEAFQNLIEYVTSSATLNIHVVATSSCLQSLQNSLLPNSNIHLFNHFVKVPASIDPINALKWTLKIFSDNALEWNINFSPEESAILRREMEGFNFKDIQSLVTEAKNLNLMRSLKCKNTDDKKKQHIIGELSYEQFEQALKTYKDCVKHNINLYNPSPISFCDIGGLEDVKSSLMENLIWPELYRELFTTTQTSLRSGILLYGVPGTAKTVLASAVAYQSKLNFISIKGPELLSKYVGSSESNVRDLFARAQAAKPCILFFDEIDSLAPRRGHDNTGVTDRVVNQLLTQLDGVEGLDRVYILAATSRPDLIDPALLRPGRLDKCIRCSLPDEKERREILEILVKNITVADDVDFKRIASATKNFSGADLKALVYNAQLERVHKCLELKQLEDGRRNLVVIQMADFLSALSSTQPSLTLDEQKHFEDIFHQFRDGGFTATQQQLKGGKVTLA